MAYSYVRYSGNGSTTNYTFSFPTISTNHIKVRVNGSLVTNWSFLSASTIQFAVAPANAAVIEIRRETPKDSPIVDFADGSVLLERDLDLLATWQLYVAQETEDDLEDTIRVDSQGRFDALNKRIINVADPVNAQDAVTKNWAETAMSSQLNQATAQATAAAGSATAAAGSASAAATSASNASTSASNAASSASGASTSATAAAGSATAAANSATAAATSATNANSSAVAAAASATASAGSATTATTQATNAAASAVSAANSAAAAATALDNFDDRYLGQKASDPSVDNDGNALITGALYYNTTDSAMRVYTGSGWINASSAQVATMKTYVYVATAAQTTFSGNDANGSSLTYVAPYLIVSLNGLELRPVVDYTASSGLSVVLTAAATAGDELQIQAFSGFNVANIQSANVTYSQGGTGSVARSVDGKLGEWISISDFAGADKSGIADSTSAIVNAITAAQTAGVPILVEGRFRYTSQITVPAKITFVGLGITSDESVSGRSRSCFIKDFNGLGFLMSGDDISTDGVQYDSVVGRTGDNVQVIGSRFRAPSISTTNAGRDGLRIGQTATTGTGVSPNNANLFYIGRLSSLKNGRYGVNIDDTNTGGSGNYPLGNPDCNGGYIGHAECDRNTSDGIRFGNCIDNYIAYLVAQSNGGYGCRMDAYARNNIISKSYTEANTTGDGIIVATAVQNVVWASRGVTLGAGWTVAGETNMVFNHASGIGVGNTFDNVPWSWPGELNQASSNTPDVMRHRQYVSANLNYGEMRTVKDGTDGTKLVFNVRKTAVGQRDVVDIDEDGCLGVGITELGKMFIGRDRVNSASIQSGYGSPEGVVSAVRGSLYVQLNGTGTSLYVKQSGTGNTGWVAK